jgi:serine/threonine-protein kinase RsbT
MTNDESKQHVFQINGLVDVVAARRAGLKTALDVGFSEIEATSIAVVISELGRNIERYAKTGVITVTAHFGTLAYVEVVAEDNGPGIEDVERVLAGGYTTSRGMGLGISGSKRLMDEFDVQSTVGEGTTIKAVKRLRQAR